MTLTELGALILMTSAKSKDKLPWLKLATFGDDRTARNCLRHDGNVLAITGIELDYDAGEMTLDQAVAIVKEARLCALLYTSPSYTDAKPKWRIVLPTSKELPPGERAKLVARVNGIFDGVFDGASFALSQSYYFGSVNNNPAHRAVVTASDCIDLRDDLDAGAIGKGGKHKAEEARPNEVRDDLRSQRLEYLKQYTENLKNLDRPPREKVIAALAIVVNDLDYNGWIEVGHEIKSWDATEVGWRIYDDWGATWPGKMKNGQLETYDTAYARVRWDSFHPTRTNIGALFNRASKISPGWWKHAQAAQPTSDEETKSHRSIPDFSTDWCDVTQIPRRQWLYEQHYIRGFVTASIAPACFTSHQALMSSRSNS